jgi:hypothetical protein
MDITERLRRREGHQRISRSWLHANPIKERQVLDARRFGVDEIRVSYDPLGRYVAKKAVSVPRPLWMAPRYREVERECPRVEWTVNGTRYAVILPVVFTENGREDWPAMEVALGAKISETLQT